MEDSLSATMTWLNKFKEIGDIITQYDPTHLALPWAGARFVLICMLSYDESMQVAAESVETTARIMHRCSVYELLYTPETVGVEVRHGFEVALVDLYGGLLHLLVRLGQFLNKNTAFRSASAILNPGSLQTLLSDVQKLESESDKEAQVCQRTQVTESHSRLANMAPKLERLLQLETSLLQVDENVKQMLEVLDGNKIREVLQWISPTMHYHHHDLVRERRTKDTCQWILEKPQYREWLEDPSSVTLWLQAPGEILSLPHERKG